MPIGNPQIGEHWVSIFGPRTVHTILAVHGGTDVWVYSDDLSGMRHGTQLVWFLRQFAYLEDLTGRWFQTSLQAPPRQVITGWLVGK